MSRPCECERVVKGSKYEASQCRVCWLYWHDPRYRSLWGGNPTEVIQYDGKEVSPVVDAPKRCGCLAPGGRLY